MTKIIASMLLFAGIILSSSCSSNVKAEKDTSELKKIAKIAAETYGSEDEVESMSIDGFVCKE